jgi:hypothetical protein
MFPRVASQLIRTFVSGVLFTVIIILLLTDSRTPSLRRTPEFIHPVLLTTKSVHEASSTATQLPAAASALQTSTKEGDAQCCGRSCENVEVNIDATGVINPHPFHWIFVEKNLCSGRRKDVFVLAVVHSAPANVKRRMHIRETWGSQRLYSKVA